MSPERLEKASDAEADAIDAIARHCGMDHGFAAREEFARPWGRVWVARAPADVDAGGLPFAAFLVAWHVADELHILNVATLVAARHRGIGGGLVGAALAYAAAQHVRIVLLEVRRSNRDALRLYRRLGFTALGMRPGYYADNGEDAIEMIIALDPATGAAQPGRDEIRIDVGSSRG